MRPPNLILRPAIAIESAFGGGARIHQPIVLTPPEISPKAFFHAALPTGGGHIPRGSQRQIRKRLRRRRSLGIKTPLGTRLVSPR